MVESSAPRRFGKRRESYSEARIASKPETYSAAQRLKQQMPTLLLAATIAWKLATGG
jgi:hypothetical protein